MTGREDAPVSRVNAENTHKHEPLRSLQLQGETHGRQEPIKISRTGQGAKSSKPTQAIYRPPKITQKNGAKVHFQTTAPTNKSSSPPTASSPVELKSALKRSKSFTSNETTADITSVGFEREAFPLEYLGLIRRAMLDPNILSCQKLMELVRLICGKAIENAQFSAPAAQLCFCIIEKEHNHTFLESLLNCCREWYNERDKLLRSSFISSSGSSRWIAYISFLTELYSRVKSQHSQMIAAQANTQGSTDLLCPHPNSPMAHLAMTLLTLLYECSHIILKPPSLNNAGEVDCLRNLMTNIGKQLEADAPQRMQQVIIHLRDAFVNPSINAQIRKTILELIELHASDWQLDLPQLMYYFPYTNFDRK